jgi:hypothetical protein
MWLLALGCTCYRLILGLRFLLIPLSVAKHKHAFMYKESMWNYILCTTFIVHVKTDTRFDYTYVAIIGLDIEP